MEVRYTRDGAGLTTMDIEVPAERVEALYQRAIKDLRRHVNVPGFRPGRVPPKMVESIIGRDKIVDYAKDMCREQIYPEAMAEVPHLVSLDEPEVELDGFALGQGATLTAKVKTAEVSLGEYKGVKVERYRAEVGDAEADTELQRQYRANCNFADAEHEAVQAGDTVVFGLRIVRDGILIEEYPADDPLRVAVGDNQLVPNIDEHLLGLMVGQDTVFEVTYPADYSNEDLRGVTVEFAVSVTAIQTRESLEAWVKRYGSFESVEAALDAVKQAIGVQRAERFRIGAREEAVKRAVEAATIDLPRSELDAAVMEEIEQMEDDLRERGATADDIDEFIESQNDAIRERVEYDRKRDIVLRAIAQAESLDLDREDLAREVGMMSTLNRVEPRLMLRRLEEEGMLGQVARNARLRKAAELVLELAEVTEVDPPAEVDEHHDHDHSDHEHHHHEHDAAATPALNEPDEEPESSEPEDEPCP